MIRNRILLKSISLFLILEVLLNTLVPTISWALTSGPTAPEYTSFEPIDTTDIVNLATGDLAYNIPLLEVPGPAGGYPLSLSYHAAIMPNEEASWVGLGFSLNPGAITRTVNGYPDDQLGTTRSRTDSDPGAERSTFDVSIGLPSVGYGLTVAHDSNLGVGFGGGVYVGGTYGPFDASLTLGVKPYGGGANASVSVGVGGGSGRLSANLYADGSGVETSTGLTAKVATKAGSIGIYTNFENVSINASSSLYSVGANISSSGIKYSHSVAGIPTSTTNSNAGSYKTETWGFTLPIPLGESGLFANIGYKYYRYWSHETSSVNLIGTLHANATSNKDRNHWAFDSYALPDPIQQEGDLNNNDPEKGEGGSFPSYDSYTVNAQGLNGSIQPYILENGNLFRQNIKKPNTSDEDHDYVIEYKNTGHEFSSPVEFRFKNDFSNTFGYSKNEMGIENSQISFDDQSDGLTSGDGISLQHLAGSKHIEWFTNEEIRTGTAFQKGFIDFQSYDQRLSSTAELSQQAGGFMITNESGVTYHYALPVYAYDEFSKSFLKEDNEVYQTNDNPDRYAYMWLLTAVTGSDFVDRNSNGMADESDWGYWVAFEYGKWADNFKWRNPATGYHNELDPKINFYSRGQKEIYYLDAIKTKTHVAIFEKEIRNDAKGLVDNDLNPAWQPVTGKRPTEMLRLKNIYLLTSEDFQTIGGNGLKTNSNQNNSCATPTMVTGHVSPCNLFEQEDEDNFAQILSKAIRVVSLDHSYDLQSGTSNSFELVNPSTLSGKLTLNTIKFLGKNGFDGIPPMSFEYNKNPQYNKDAYDIWGFYKSDYQLLDNSNLERIVTYESALDVDAWSLSGVKTSIGSKIKFSYESDIYNKVSIMLSNLFRIKNITRLENSKFRLSFHEDLDLTKYFKVNESIFCSGTGFYEEGSYEKVMVGNSECQESSNNFLHGYAYFKSTDALVTNVASTYIEIEDSDLEAKLYDVIVESQDYVCCSGDCSVIDNYSINDIKRYYNGFIDFTIGGYATNVSNVPTDISGGGLRVKSISVEDIEKTTITKYQYFDGSTSYEPYMILPPKSSAPPNSMLPPELQNPDPDWFNKYLLNPISEELADLFAISREVPAPGIIYEKTIVEEEILPNGASEPIQLPGKKVFDFQTFDKSLVQKTGMNTTVNLYTVTCKDAEGEPVPCDGSGSVPPVNCKDQNGDPISCNTPYSTTTTPLAINDFSSWVGTLKSISIYGPNDEIIKKVENHYLHDDKTTGEFKNQLKDQYKNQGAITQIFNEYREVPHEYGQVRHFVYSKKNEYPLVGIGQTVTDYKTGITATTSNLTFDFYSGQPTKVLSTDGYGNAYVSESVPAYKISEYSGMTPQQINNQFVGMGLKVKNSKNKHMLSQWRFRIM